MTRKKTSPASKATAIRAPAEQRYAKELHALAANDEHPRPAHWALSPHSVLRFIAGTEDEALPHTWKGKRCKTVVTKKFYGDYGLLQRCVVTLLGNRGLLLIGEPGTAKSMLSELLAAAICNHSTCTVQGSAGTSTEQIKYSWNYAELLANGPSPEALVKAPLFSAMQRGMLLRFEEITRCPAEIQDVLISVMSDKVLQVPELHPPDDLLLAKPGFNIIATANTRDRGVHEMSSALKRRFNFETVHPIASPQEELKLVKSQVRQALDDAKIETRVPEDLLALLVETFQDLRTGQSKEGTQVDRPSSVMSSAEAVSVGIGATMDAHYFEGQAPNPEHVARQLLGTALKDEPEDAKKIAHYFDVVVKKRGQQDPLWQAFFRARTCFERKRR